MQSRLNDNCQNCADMANAIRALSMDAVQKANPEHPGMPIGMAIAEKTLAAEFNKLDSHDCHGSPLGKDGVEATYKALGWAHAPFDIPLGTCDLWNGRTKAEACGQAWDAQFAKYSEAYPDLVKAFDRHMAAQMTLPAIYVFTHDSVALGQDGPVKTAIVETGRDVQIAVEAQQKLAAQGIHTRVVSMPSTTRFDQQADAYRESVLGRAVPVVAVEAGGTGFWRKYSGRRGQVVGIDVFGETAPPNDFCEHSGVTGDAICQAVIRTCESKAA